MMKAGLVLFGLYVLSTHASVFASPVSTACTESDLNVILRHHRAARSDVAQVNAMKITGQVFIAGNAQPITIYRARPNLLRVEFSLRGDRGVIVYNGKRAVATGKAGTAFPVDDGSFAADADFDGPLLASDSSDAKLSLVGTTRLADREVYEIAAAATHGATEVYSLDCKTFLTLRRVRSKPASASPLDLPEERRYSDYKRLSEIVLPTRVAVDIGGPLNGQIEVRLDKLEILSTIDGQLFARP